MQKNTTHIILITILLLLCFNNDVLHAQVIPKQQDGTISAKPPQPGQRSNAEKMALAAEYYRNRDFEKAAKLFKELFDSRRSSHYYNYYVQSLIYLGEHKEALKFVKDQLKIEPGNNRYKIDLGYVNASSGKSRKATKTYMEVIDEMPADRNIIIATANHFRMRMLNDYVIKTYEKGQELLGSNTMFGLNLANIYEIDGNFQKATETYLDLLEHDPSMMASVQNRLQRALEKDEDNEKHTELRGQLIRKAQKFPGNTVFPEMIIWLSIQEKDFDLALTHAQVLDRRYQEDGQRMFEISGLAASNEDYETALKALNAIIKKGKDGSMYSYARIRQLVVRYMMYAHSPANSTEKREKLAAEFEDVLSEFGLHQGTADLAISYARLKAYDMNQADEAIELLTTGIGLRNISQPKIADLKVELADIYLYTGQPWEATLLYSQVEKNFKNDLRGHNAKFKNAQLSFYIGEFGWAKTQVDVLKAATSKLIANDAMELALLISDNPDPDSSQYGLQLFAEASLMAYRKHFSEALIKLDSIGLLGMSHPLDDDVLLKKAEIRKIQGDLMATDSLLNKLYEFYPDGILADNALIKLAELYDYESGNPEKAMLYYKKLITDYPGSVFTERARNRFRFLRQSEQATEQIQ